MLVLTRKIGQKLIIDNDTVVTVLEVKGDSIKLGIEAPKNVSIYRQELFEEIRKANQAAIAEESPSLELLNLDLPNLPVTATLPANKGIKPLKQALLTDVKTDSNRP